LGTRLEGDFLFFLVLLVVEGRLKLKILFFYDIIGRLGSSAEV
jgi:hypothetical protein